MLAFEVTPEKASSTPTCTGWRARTARRAIFRARNVTAATSSRRCATPKGALRHAVTASLRSDAWTRRRPSRAGARHDADTSRAWRTLTISAHAALTARQARSASASSSHLEGVGAASRLPSAGRLVDAAVRVGRWRVDRLPPPSSTALIRRRTGREPDLPARAETASMNHHCAHRQYAQRLLGRRPEALLSPGHRRARSTT